MGNFWHGHDGAHGVTRPTRNGRVAGNDRLLSHLLHRFRFITLPRMDLPVRKKLPHTIPQWVAVGSWFFITIKCVPPGKNQLCRADTGSAVLAAAQDNHVKLVWHCRLCLLMPDHVHAILAFPPDPGMETVIKNWKKFLAGKLGVRWQRDFFDHRLRNHHEVDEKTSYILMNPVRKGLCERMEDWSWVYCPNDRLPPQLG